MFLRLKRCIKMSFKSLRPESKFMYESSVWNEFDVHEKSFLAHKISSFIAKNHFKFNRLSVIKIQYWIFLKFNPPWIFFVSGRKWPFNPKKVILSATVFQWNFKLIRTRDRREPMSGTRPFQMFHAYFHKLCSRFPRERSREGSASLLPFPSISD